MILNPITAYRLAAQAQRAHEALAGENISTARSLDNKVTILVTRLNRARQFGEDQARSNARLHADLADRNAKIARMTSGLKRGASKRACNADGSPEGAALVAGLNAA